MQKLFTGIDEPIALIKDEREYIYSALQEASEGIYEQRFEDLTVEQKCAIAEGTLVELMNHYSEQWEFHSHHLHVL